MKKIILCTSLCLSLSSFALIKSVMHKQMSNTPIKPQLGGGAMDGGGSGGEFPFSGAAWFYQGGAKDYIDACIVRAKNFRATEEEIKVAIKRSYKIWSEYMIKHELEDDKTDADTGETIPFPKPLKILKTIKFNPCHKKTQLTFYMGVLNKEVQRVRENYPDYKAFAFRYHKNIDIEKGTSKGMIWIFNPEDPTQSTDQFDKMVYDWSDKDRLQGMLLHEIGHTFGNGHVTGTIMSETLRYKYWLAGSANQPEQAKLARKHLNQINHESKLVKDFLNDSHMAGVLGIPGSLDEKETFKEFMGRALVGTAKVELKMKDANIDMTLSDKKGAKTFQISVKNIESFNFNPIFEEAFKIYRSYQETQPDGTVVGRKSERSHPNIGAQFSIKANLLNREMYLDFSMNHGTHVLMHEDKQYYSFHPLAVYYINKKGARKPLFIFDPKTMDDITDGNDTSEVVNF